MLPPPAGSFPGDRSTDAMGRARSSIDAVREPANRDRGRRFGRLERSGEHPARFRLPLLARRSRFRWRHRHLGPVGDGPRGRSDQEPPTGLLLAWLGVLQCLGAPVVWNRAISVLAVVALSGVVVLEGGRTLPSRGRWARRAPRRARLAVLASRLGASAVQPVRTLLPPVCHRARVGGRAADGQASEPADPDGSGGCHDALLLPAHARRGSRRAAGRLAETSGTSGLRGDRARARAARPVAAGVL